MQESYANPFRAARRAYVDPAARVFVFAGRQPSFAVRLAFLALAVLLSLILLVLLIPLTLLFALAMLVMAAVGSLRVKIGTWVKPRDREGRRNVRVVAPHRG